MNGSRDTARKALAAALDPDSCRVDERTHRDRLAFAAAFAQLIVYYDSTNQAAGDWRGFFLKDPAILMAAISNARPESYYNTFTPSLLAMGVDATPDDAEVVAITQVCTLSMNLFSMLDRWYHLMDQAPQAYVLHPFLKTRIETSLGEQLWMMVALQQALSIESQGRIEPPDYLNLRGFDPIWERVWTGHQRVASIAFPDGRAKLQQIYQTVYSVFVQVVEYAGHAFRECEHQTTRFPDTALLMVFSRLMDIQQNEINALGRKHLDFYYERVLKLGLRPAQADEVYVCLNLQAGNETFNLPARTPFKAGTYADGSDVVFVNDEAASLSRAKVISVGTPFYASEGPAAGLYLNTVRDIDQLLYTPAHGIRAWRAGGSAEGSVLQPGFAFASPMLLLNSGERTITFGLQFADAQALSSTSLDADNRFYFSTEKGWFEVSPVTSAGPAVSGLLTVQFRLQPTDPAIVALKPGLDSAASPWPMFKAVMNPALAVREAPTLLAVTIDVIVDDGSPVAMANDNGALPLTGTLQMFGPVPVAGGSFYVGSNECFAKPLNGLQLRLQWEGLPADFAHYYQTYNQYLAQAPDDRGASFSNSAFQVSCTVLGALAPEAEAGNAGEGTVTPLFEQIDGPPPSTGASPQQLNATTSTFQLRIGADSPFVARPTLALGPLPVVSLAKAGYLRLQLTAPALAFGHGLYAKVVTYVSLHNAQTLIGLAREEGETLADKLVAGIKHVFATIKGWFGKPTAPSKPATTATPPQSTAEPDNGLLDMPNLPFSPAIRSASLHYSASVTVSFAEPTAPTGYPFSLFHYGPFMTQEVYDTQQPATSSTSLPLYPQVGLGSLYLALSAVSAPCTLSLLVGMLCDDSPLPADGVLLTCHGWMTDGWRSVDVLRDDTCNLSCPGIITLDIPAPHTQPPVDAASLGLPADMPGDAFWLAIVAPGQARHVQLTYINTQAVKLRRSPSASMHAGDVPWIAASTLVATQQKIKQIASVVQPFDSFGGQPGEDRESFDRPNSFYQRVSTRLNHKDRASSASHYVNLAYEACPALYYARVLAGDSPGSLRIGLVNSYADARLPDAFAPQVSAVDLPVIERYLASRASAMAQISVINLQHQVVQINAQLVIAATANGNEVIKSLNRQLRLYLSPWIDSDAPQMSLDRGLSRSELINVITAHADVLSVASLKLSIAPPGEDVSAAVVDTSDPLQAMPQAILVSAAAHRLVTSTRQVGLEVSHGG